MKIVSDNSQLKYKNMTNANSSTPNETTLIRNSRVITKTKEGNDIIDDILRNSSFVGVDCKGVNLGASGQITLVQIAYTSASDPVLAPPRIYIFDVLLNPDFLKHSLKQLFESENIVKVIHDSRNYSSALYSEYGITLTNIFDTQVAHSIIQQQNTGRPAYKAKYISLNILCELYGGPKSNPKKEQMKKLYRKDQKYWSHRPLTEEMIYYSAYDVFALVPDVYNNISKSIRPEYLPLLKQLNLEAIFSKINPEEVKQLKKQRKLDMEVTDLKLKLFNSEAKQIVLSNREIRLLRFSSTLIPYKPLSYLT
jgi:exonuclease 3'-5' domain-containing protein 1